MVREHEAVSGQGGWLLLIRRRAVGPALVTRLVAVWGLLVWHFCFSSRGRPLSTGAPLGPKFCFRQENLRGRILMGVKGQPGSTVHRHHISPAGSMVIGRHTMGGVGGPYSSLSRRRSSSAISSAVKEAQIGTSGVRMASSRSSCSCAKPGRWGRTTEEERLTSVNW